MKLRVIGPNQTEVEADGIVVFFSYNTPVAAQVNGQLFETDLKYSVTTTKHVRNWLAGKRASKKEQSFFDSLLVASSKGGAK